MPSQLYWLNTLRSVDRLQVNEDDARCGHAAIELRQHRCELLGSANIAAMIGTGNATYQNVSQSHF
jgi:hypothetical protein